MEEYLQEVWDSLEPAWDKSKFDMKQSYDSEYECDCITITSKDNEGVRAKMYVNDYEGRHPVGFDVVYRYPGDKGVGVMGSYEFQSTDMDNLGEEVFDYFDEIKKKAAGASFESDLQAYADAVKADKYLCFKENFYTAPASITGLPAVVTGGVQLVGRAFSEAALLDLAELSAKEGK